VAASAHAGKEAGTGVRRCRSGDAGTVTTQMSPKQKPAFAVLG
jgi:hypothetical protein